MRVFPYSNVLKNIGIRKYERNYRKRGVGRKIWYSNHCNNGDMETRALEKIVKGFANHRRIEILALISRQPNLSVLDISDELRVNFKTIS